MSLSVKIKLLILMNHVILLTWMLSDSFNWCILLFGSHLAWYLGAKMGMDIGFHRLFAHRSFKTTKFKERFLLLIGTFSCIGSSISFSGAHRMHHKHSDNKGDPHNSQTLKRWEIWLTFFKDDWHVSPIVIKDLLKDPWHRYTHTHYFKIVGAFFAFLTLLCIMFNSLLPLGLWSLSVVFNFHAAGLMNSFCHASNIGYRNYETNDTSRNSTVLHFLFGLNGGFLHNNHHGDPKAYDLNPYNRWYEFDMGGWIIKKFFVKIN